MKFDRFPRWEYRESNRAQENYSRKCERQALAAGMFADEIRAGQLPVAAELERRQEASKRDEARWRAFHAVCWVKARREYFTLAIPLRAEIKADWEAWTGPATAVYFSGFVLDFRRKHGLAPMPDYSHMNPKPRIENFIQPTLGL